jgi:competence protein ComEC
VRDRTVVLMAACVWLGASIATPFPRWLAVVVVGVALAWHRPLLVVVGVTLLATSLGADAREGLTPVDAHAFAGEVLLVGDPVPLRGGAVRVDVRAGDDRFEATARGRVARQLRDRAAGDLVTLSGRVTPRPADAPWLEVRHVVGRLAVESVDAARPGAFAGRVANGVRGLLARGARALPADQRSLYTGLVYGDDRGQSPLLVDDLRAAGLGHLLAVSGQNVAVLLGAARPLLERWRYRVRFPATLALLGLLVLVTRAEPSVLRATAMAGVVALAAAMGRARSALRVLALAVSALVLVDPLLVRAVGFQLSIAATAGIVVLARPIAARLAGPGWARELLAVPIAAQLAVAPLVVRTFGGLPVAALPANLLAAPVAGPVMVWGVTGGVVAGGLGGPVASLVHLPTRVALWWIRAVSAVAGRVPLGELRAAHLVVVTAAGAVALLRTGRIRVLALVATALALAQPAWALRDVERDGAPVAGGVSLWQGDGATVVVVEPLADPRRTLEALRRAGVRRIDVLVAASGGVRTSEVTAALDARYAVGATWAPPGHQVRGARTAHPGTLVRAGPFDVAVIAADPRLVVTVSRRAG